MMNPMRMQVSDLSILRDLYGMDSYPIAEHVMYIEKDRMTFMDCMKVEEVKFMNSSLVLSLQLVCSVLIIAKLQICQASLYRCYLHKCLGALRSRHASAAGVGISPESFRLLCGASHHVQLLTASMRGQAY